MVINLTISEPRIAFSRFLSYTARVNPFDLDPKEYVPVLALLKQIDFLESVPEPELKNILFSLQKQDFSSGKTILFRPLRIGELTRRHLQPLL